MKSLFKITLPKIILAFVLIVLPIGIRILSLFTIFSSTLAPLTPTSASNKISFLITTTLYVSHIIFLPFNAIIGNFILLTGAELLGDSFYIGGTLTSVLFYCLYFIMEFLYSFILSSFIFIVISQFQKAKK